MEKYHEEAFINESSLKMPGEGFLWHDAGSRFDYATCLNLLDLEKFPIIEDFHVILYRARKLRFVSKELGLLTTFPWRDDLEKTIQTWKTEDIFIGTRDYPFHDHDENGGVIIFEHEDFVYILESDDPDSLRNINAEYQEFYVWYRTPKEKYIAAWERLFRVVKNMDFSYYRTIPKI